MEILTILYFVFIIVSLYISFLFLILFFKNKSELFKEEILGNLPFISVLIPAYNEEDTITDTINAVKAVDYPKNKLEIIAINDGSKDNTLSEMQKIENITILDKTNSGKADSLNQAIKIAKGEFIAVIDADSFPNKDSILKMVSYFKDEKVAAVTSSILVRNKERILEKLQAIEYTIIAWARKLLQFIGSIYVTPGPLSIYRKKVLQEIGGFDKKNITEDIEITWNILSHLYETRMCLSATVYTIVPKTIRGWWKQRLRWYIGAIQTMYKYKHVFLRPKYGMLGLFIFPLVLNHFILTIFGFTLYSYFITKGIIFSFLNIKYTIIAKIPVLSNFSLNINSTVFTFFLVFLFALTMIYAVFGLRSLAHRNDVSLIKGASFWVYLLFYFLLFPPVLVHSLLRIVLGKVTW